MAYWGTGMIENDFAFDGVGAYVLLIRNRMMSDARNVLKKRHPEQAIVATIRCLRLLDAEFPKCVRVSFRKKHLRQAEQLFIEWYELVADELPSDMRVDIRLEAESEFRRYHDQLTV